MRDVSRDGSGTDAAVELRGRCPARMRPGGDPLRKPHAGDRSVSYGRRVEDQTLGEVAHHVGGERDQVAVVLGRCTETRGERRLAAVDTLTEGEAVLASGLQVLLH